MPDFDFTGKVAIVTGASRGIGRFLSQALTKRGASVVGTARKLDSSPGEGGTLKETADLIGAAGGRFLPVAGSITESPGAQDVVDRAVAEYGRVDILVNNAGALIDLSITEMTDEQWESLLSVNVTAPFLMTRAVFPVMKAQGSGNILNVSSGAGVANPRGTSALYASTKAFLERMTFNFAVEAKEFGIAVNAWQPGILATDMNAGRQPGEPVEIIEESTIWLLAQNASAFTGQIVRRNDFGDSWGPNS
jgi:3-oxoacyl-[acyl-carrier protein] reductase